MTRQLRDVIISLAALSLLFLLLMAVSPRLRERATELGTGDGSRHLELGRAIVGHALESTLGAASGYAVNNTYLFIFLVFACVLFVLMVRT
jgi:hypothetical protein